MDEELTRKIGLLLEQQIDKFETSIMNIKENEIEGHRTIKTSPIFPIFPIDDETYYLIDKYNRLINASLETYVIRDFIILGLLEKGLDIRCLHQFEKTQYERGIIVFKGNNYNGCFSFLINRDGFYDAYIIEKSVKSSYSDFLPNYEIIEFRNNGINIENVYHLDFSDNDYYNFDYFNDENNRIHHYKIKIEKFIEDEFDSEFSKKYIDSIIASMNKATKIIGYKSLPKLTSNYLYRLKTETKERFNNIDILELRYNLINKNNRKDIVSALKNTTHLETVFTEIKTIDISKERLNNQVHECLVGKSDFAKAFLTSEYLFFSNKEKNADSKDKYSSVIDFTPIISGYAKSVELLLYKILEWYMESYENNPIDRKYFYRDQKYYYDIEDNIKKNKLYDEEEKRVGNKEVVILDDKDDIKGKKYILVSKKYEEYFNSSLGSLYKFLLSKDNDLIYLPNNNKNETTEYLNKITKCFELYTRECRNTPFHRGLIKDFNDVVNIRDNTIFIIYLILLSVKVPFEEEELKNRLECEDDKFDMFYHYIVTNGERKFFRFHYSNLESKLVYLIKLNNIYTEYDENGLTINNPLCFIEVNDTKIDENEYNLFMEVKKYGDISLIKDRIVLFDREHCPIKIEKLSYKLNEEGNMLIKDDFVDLYHVFDK